MENNCLSNKKWTDKDIEIIKHYAKTNSEILRSNMIINIIAGFNRFRKPKTFFIRLGQILNKCSKLCKSKFQKLEEEIYKEELGTDDNYYDTYKWIRKLRKSQANYDFQKMNSIFKINSGSSSSEEEDYLKNNKRLIEVNSKCIFL